jgi:hypothetical protein
MNDFAEKKSENQVKTCKYLTLTLSSRIGNTPLLLEEKGSGG